MYVFIFHHRITEWFGLRGNLKVIKSHLLQQAGTSCKFAQEVKRPQLTNKMKHCFLRQVWALMSFIAMDVQKKKRYHVLPQLWEQIQHDAEAQWAAASHILQVPVRKGEWCLIHCLGDSLGELHALSFCWWNSHSVMLNATEWEGQDVYS